MMRSIMGLRILKVVVPVLVGATTVVAAVALFPETADAACPGGRRFCLRFSGSPNNSVSFLDFDLDPSVLDTNPRPDEGLFRGAILGATYRTFNPSCPTGNLGDFSGCNLIESLSFGSGDLISTRRPSGLVQYKSSPLVDNSNSLEFAFFTSSSDPDSLNLDLDEPIRATSFLNAPFPNDVSESVPLPFSVSEVPEPTTGLILGVGVSGAMLFWKRRKQLS